VEAQVQSQDSSSANLIGARFHIFPLALPTFFITSTLHIYIHIFIYLFIFTTDAIQSKTQTVL